MRLLLTGDIHIGRSSSLPQSDGSGKGVRAAEAWRRIVDTAIAEDVRVVCLSGDIADTDNSLWEALGPLERGVSRLAAHGILVVAVSGNHDFDVLARLADQFTEDQFKMLGRGGRWERFTIFDDERPVLHIDGWSFPSERVMTSPLLDYDLEASSKVPILGLIHGDLDVPGSVYGPLSLDDLLAQGPDAWLLGHIHAPKLMRQAGKWVLYPGSPQALDFGETGVHGPWIVRVEAGFETPVQRPLSTVRYASLTVDLDGVNMRSAVESAIISGLRDQSKSVVTASEPGIENLYVRLRLTGRTALSYELHEIADRLKEDLDLSIGTARLHLDRVDVATLPDIDLAEYASAPSAPGAIARILVELDKPEVSKDIGKLIEDTRRQLEDVSNSGYFSALEKREVTEEEVRDFLRQQSKRLLTQLIAQVS